MTRWGVLTVVLGSLLTTASPALAAPTPRQRLRDAASGTWSSEFGTLEFHDDETATFTVRVCGYSPLEPGFVEVFTDCPADVVTGDLIVRSGRYVINAADGGEYNFGAYVDGEEMHVGPGGSVTRLSRNREGTLDMGGGSTLRIRDGKCRYKSPDDSYEAKCRFAKRDGRTVLLYRWPDPLRGGKITRAGLVYLEDQRLLVSPELFEYAYTRGVT